MDYMVVQNLGKGILRWKNAEKMQKQMINIDRDIFDCYNVNENEDTMNGGIHYAYTVYNRKSQINKRKCSDQFCCIEG